MMYHNGMNLKKIKQLQGHVQFPPVIQVFLSATMSSEPLSPPSVRNYYKNFTRVNDLHVEKNEVFNQQ